MQFMQYLFILVTVFLYTSQTLLSKLFTREYPNDKSMATYVYSVTVGITVFIVSLFFSRFRVTLSALTALLAVINGIVLFIYNSSLISASRKGPYSVFIVFSITGSIIIPAVFFNIMGWDSLSPIQFIAVFTTVPAIYLVGYKDKNNSSEENKISPKFIILCIVNMLANGIYGIMLTLQQKFTGECEREEMTALTFMSAAVIALFFIIYRKKREFLSVFKNTAPSLIFLLSCATCSAVSVNIFVVLVTLIENKSILYTFNSAGVMVCSVIFSCILFKEKLNSKNIIGCIMICAALTAMAVL